MVCNVFIGIAQHEMAEGLELMMYELIGGQQWRLNRLTASP